MSNQENNMQVLEGDMQPESMRLTKSKFMPKKKAKNPLPVLLGESILVAGAIPIILFRDGLYKTTIFLYRGYKWGSSDGISV